MTIDDSAIHWHQLMIRQIRLNTTVGFGQAGYLARSPCRTQREQLIYLTQLEAGFLTQDPDHRGHAFVEPVFPDKANYCPMLLIHSGNAVIPCKKQCGFFGPLGGVDQESIPVDLKDFSFNLNYRHMINGLTGKMPATKDRKKKRTKG